MSLYKNIYTLIARDITTDMSDKMTTLHKLIDFFSFEYDTKQLDAQGKSLGEEPIIFQNIDKFTIGTSWYTDEEFETDTTFQLKLTIIAPNGESVEGPQQTLTIPKGNRRFSANFLLDALPVVTKGEYTLQADLLTEDSSKTLATGAYSFDIFLSEK
jgi:hypothetical protein